MKKFISKILLFTLFVIIIALPLLYYNYIIDPYRVFSNDFDKPSLRINSRYQTVNYIFSHPGMFDSYVIGSSRVRGIKNQWIPNGNYYTIALPGSPLEEQVDVIKLLLERTIVKNIIICIDDLSYLLHSENLKASDARKPYPRNLGEQTKFFSDYLFLPYNEEATQAFIKNRNSHVSPIDIIPQDTLHEKISFDGNFKTQNRFREPNERASLRLDLERALESIEELNELSKKHGFRLIMFFHPLNMQHYQNLDIDTYLYFMQKVAQIHDFYDFSGVNFVTTNDYFYKDLNHHTELVGQYIVGRLFNIMPELPADFGIYVNSTNINNHIKYHRQKFSEYILNPDLKLYEYNYTSEKPLCKINTINNQSIDSSSLITINTNELTITGWAFDTKANKRFEKIFIKIGDRLFKTKSLKRPDIAKLYKNPKMRLSGFSINIETDKLEEGYNNISIFVTDTNKNYYQAANICKIVIKKTNPRILDSVINQDIQYSFTVDDEPIENTAYRKGIILNLQGFAYLKTDKKIIFDEIYVKVNNVMEEVSYGKKINKKGIEQDTIIFPLIDVMLNDIQSKDAIAEYDSIDANLIVDTTNTLLIDSIQNNQNKQGPPKKGYFSLNIPNHFLNNGLNRLQLYYLSRKENILIPITNEKYVYFEKVTLPDVSKWIPISNTTHHSINFVNDVPFISSDSAITISGDTVRIVGWAVDKMNVNPSGGVVFTLDKKVHYIGCWLSKKDVAQRYGIPDYQNSGFEIAIPLTNLKNGQYDISMKIFSDDFTFVYPGTSIKINLQR